MKKRYLFVIFSLVLIFALSFSSCNDDKGEYSVTFDYNYEGAAVTVLKTQNGNVQFVDEPQRDNYKFMGWYLDREGLTRFTEQSVTADTVLYAKWQKSEDGGTDVECSITFSINGGDGTLPQNVTVTAGSSYTLPSGEGLTRDGYVFDGWKSSEAVYAAGDIIVVETDIEFAAIWASTTTVVFDLNGGTGTAPQNIIVKSGADVVLPSGANISKEGYSFDGWLDKSDKLCLAGKPYSVSQDATVTLRAAWSGEYKLTLVSGGSSEQLTVNTGVETLLGAGKNIAGKEFTGWLDESTETIYIKGDKFVCAYSDVTLTAQYEDTLAVTYCDWDGTVLKRVSYLDGETITVPDLFITKYAEFDGWDKDLSSITESTTVIAQYNYTFTDMRYFDLDFSGSYSTRYGGYFIKLSDLANALPALTDIKFPISWKGAPVIGVYSAGSAPINSVFYRYITLKTVYIPSSFKLIPTYAFYDCIALEEVKFSATCNVTQIGSSAFSGCTSMKTFTMPKSVTTLVTTPYGESYTIENVGSGRQFSGCTALEEFIFEEGSALTKLAGYMFGECSSLEKIVNLPTGVTVLPNSLFRNCESLRSFVIPARITILGGWVFDSCKALNELVFEGDNVSVIGQYAFTNTAITELNVPSKITSIPHNMAYGCTQLVKVVLGANVETIDYEAFGNCPKLAYFNSEEEGLFVMPNSIRYINAGAFMYAASMKQVELNEGLLSIGNGAFAAYYKYNDRLNESVGLTEITIPASVIFLGEDVFEADRYLENITILSDKLDFETWDGIMYRKSTKALAYCPLAKIANRLEIREGTVEIEEFAFASTTGIVQIVCPESLTKIGTGAFQLSNISEVIFNEGLLTIGEASLYMLDKLAAVNIPASVVTIENDAFRECVNLATLTFASDSALTTIGRMVFYRTAIAEVEIPASVIDMGIGVFQNCKSLKTVTFGEGSKLEYIEQNTFNSSGLESIELPSSVKELRYNSLSYNNLKSIDLKNVVTIGQQVFTSTKLVSVYIPASVTTLGVNAFSQIQTLTSVVFAENSQLAVIDNFAFYNDKNLKELTLPASITNINMSAFVGVELDKLTLTSPRVVSVFENAFGSDVTGVIKQLFVPANLVVNYKNHEVWSKISAEILAI